MSYRILALLAIILCVSGSSQAAPQPPAEFLLAFNFQPPLATKGDVPTVMLEVCRNDFCNGIQTVITLNCLASSRGNSGVVYFHECSAHAGMTLNGPDINMSYLSRSVMLRLRMNNITSQPFLFPGGAATVPPTAYSFVVALRGSRFTVHPR